MSAFTPYTGSPTGTTTDNPTPGEDPVVFVQNDGYAITSADSFQQPLETLANSCAYLLDGYNKIIDGYVALKSVYIDENIYGQAVSPAPGSLFVSNNSLFAGPSEFQNLVVFDYTTVFVGESVFTSNPGFTTPSGSYTAKSVGGEYVLNTDMTDVQTTVILTIPPNWPSSGFVKIGIEYISYASISSATLTGCGRGVAGSTPNSHTAGDLVTYYEDPVTPQLSPTIVSGTLYSSNVPCFMARVNSDGSMVATFGITKIDLSGGTGIYKFTTILSDPSTFRMVLTVSENSDGGQACLTAKQDTSSTNTFTVKIKDLSNTLIAAPFSVIGYIL